ncbi:hypothetical protein B0H11DRAFT_2218858 [Mycena galericulata]|nr:hypothetical protein B0H11DRAFT_2218858 [Mycena galericulata]
MSQPPVLIAGACPQTSSSPSPSSRTPLIDKEPTPRIGSRGSSMQPRTLELYPFLGVLPAFLNKASDTSHPMRCMYALPLPGGTKELPTNGVIIAQDVHEGVLHADRVVARLVGADGVHSVVRQGLGLSFSFLGATSSSSHVLVGSMRGSTAAVFPALLDPADGQSSAQA